MGSCFSKEGPGSELSQPELPAEEKVKEVLSETPARPRPRPRPRPVEDATGLSPVRSEVSFGSEALSVSTPKEKNRVPELSPARYRAKRSLSGELPLRRDAVDISCGGVRSSPSPVRRRESAVGRTNSAREPRMRTQPAGNVPSRSPGKRSPRRSVSPAINQTDPRTPGGQRRSLSAPRRIGNVGNNGKASPGKRRTTLDAPPDSGRQADGESLENPLVSLECFIFL